MSITELKNRFDSFIGDVDESHRFWLVGYLSGLLESNEQAILSNHSEVTKPPPDKQIKILIAYASQTGNARRIAEQLYQKMNVVQAHVQLEDCARIQPSQLKSFSVLWFVVSTHGEGEPPESASHFFDQLERRQPDITGCNYGVVALGDNSYDHFCATGQWLDQQLNQLGGQTIHPYVACDVDYQVQVDPWLEQAIAVSQSKANEQMPNAQQQSSHHSHTATLVDKQLLNDQRSDKHTWHLEFECSNSYAPGDALAITPTNPADLVAHLQEKIQPFLEAEDFHALQEQLPSIDCSRLTENQCNSYQELGNTQLEQQYKALDSQEKKQWLSQITLSRLLTDYPPSPSKKKEFGTWLQQLLTLRPRLYSIASSPLVSPDEIHIAVRVIDRDTASPLGITSNMLRELELDSLVSIGIQQQDHFRLPSAIDTDVIMIAAGTGIAPYRSFLQHRQAQNSQARHWLFYGDRRMRYDFLYQQEILQWRKSGLLSQVDTAFSRDSNHPVYVQDRIAHQENQLWEWLQQGASIYVCGGTAMATAVHATLLNIFASHTDEQQAEDFISELRATHRYQRDIY